MLTAESDMFCDVNKLRRAGFNSQVCGNQEATYLKCSMTEQGGLHRMPLSSTMTAVDICIA